MADAATERRIRPLVAGQRREGAATTEVRDRTSGEVFATVAAGDPELLESAADAARAAVPTELETGVVQRADWCGAVADALRDDTAGLADALVREVGVPITSARAEVATAASEFDRVADTVRALTGKYRTWTTESGAGDNSLVTAAPLGAVQCRPRRRAPLASAARQVAPAVAAGNGVVLTPPATGAVTVSMLARTLSEHLPADAVGLVPGLDDDRERDTVDGVLDAEPTTGVTRVRQRVGGGAATLVFPDADLDTAADAITAGGPDAVERRLAGTSRVFAHTEIQADLLERIDARLDDWTAGDLFAETTSVAPMADAPAVERLSYYLDDAVAKGATVVRGGEADGLTVEPTLLADVPSDAALARVSNPAPVVTVTPFESDGDALERASAAGPAQTISVFTERHSLAMTVADAVDAGTVRVGGEDADRAVGGARAAIERLTHTKRVVQ